jgi:putative protease
MKQKPEILAPAGDFACLGSAIKAGCDAVYFGLAGAFNMRAGARNFALAELDEVSALCRTAGVKAYLTVNAVVSEPDRAAVSALLEQIRGRVDAVICWDLAVIGECRRLGIPFHVSTQASVANLAAARFYREIGAERVIPARECTLEEIAILKRDSGLEVEVFVHGAMCVAVSGRCFMSQLVFNRSANKGDCGQNCRRSYRVTEVKGEGEFVLDESRVLSARDLCALPFLERVLETGVDSLKIEGRNRNPQYVRTVVGAYRAAVDAWAEDRLTDELKQQLVAEVSRVYHRGFSPGFFFGRQIGDFAETDGSQASEIKQYVGRVVNFYARPQVAEIQVQDQVFAVGDRLCFEGNKTGCEEFLVTEVRQNECPVAAVGRGTVTVRLPFEVRENDKVYLYAARELANEAGKR